MTDNATFGWAVLYPFWRGWYAPGSPLPDTIAPTRKQAMERFVADWRHSRHDGLEASRVWQFAYRRGWRLSRVKIVPFAENAR